MYRVMKHYSKMKQPVPHIFVQLYSYQARRSRSSGRAFDEESLWQFQEAVVLSLRWAGPVPTSMLLGGEP